MMNSTTTPTTDSQELKSLGLEDAASPLPLLILVFAQIYLLFLVATSRSTFAQVMLMTCVESLLVWLLTTLFFSRTWQGFFRRCGELLIMTIVLAMFMLIFGLLETTWGADNDDLSNWFEEMRAMVASGRFIYGLVYVVILAAGWLFMAWQSGNARPWWAANVAAPASVNFGGMFMACAAGAIMIVVFSSRIEEGHHVVQVHAPHGITPILLLIVYSVTRTFLSWTMVTKFTPEEWRKTEAQLYFDEA
jgi:hypothetical protein